ncbi:hypothetical protein JCM6882_001312 [Rhodosporidiobolus microsporus]
MSYTAPPVPCIIDTDPGVDDVIALLLALSSRHLLVLGITVTHGNTTLSAAADNLKKLFFALERQLEQLPELLEQWKGVDPQWRKQYGAGPIEVFLGSEGPIEGEAVTAKYFHGVDGLANCATRHPDLTTPPSHISPFFTLSTSSALSGVTSLISRRPSPTVAYVALGPLTSLAQLHLSNPSLLPLFSVILSMGGAVAHPGNTTPVAEYNVYADPAAANVIFQLALPNFYLFPLDLTSYLTLPFALYESAVDPSFATTKSPSQPAGKPPLTHFTSSFLEGTREIMASFGGEAMELHDPTVVYALIEWARAGAKVGERDGTERGTFAPGWTWQQVAFEVETHGRLTRGMLVRDLRHSSQSTTSLTARTGLTNRTQAIEAAEALDVEEVEAHRAEGERSGEEAQKRHATRSGARVVERSPGDEAMRRELLWQVWGVDLEEVMRQELLRQARDMEAWHKKNWN